MKFRQRNSHILRRIQNIEDVQEISFLKAAYCAGCDDDHNGDTVAALFVPAGVWATSMSGEHHGHDAIRTFFRSVRDRKNMKNSTHMVTNEVITVSGYTANASWSFTMMYTSPDEKRYRILGFYRDTFVRTSSGWRFASLYSDVQDYAILETQTFRHIS
jgi:hypothetical protein